MLIIALSLEELNTSVPQGHFRFLILFPLADALANEYSVGCTGRARTLLWRVSVVIVLPTMRSRKNTVVSMLLVITCGSLSCHFTSATVTVCTYSEHINLRFCANVSNASLRISAGSNEDVECWVQAKSIHSGKMSMIVPDELVYFQVQTFYHL